MLLLLHDDDDDDDDDDGPTPSQQEEHQLDHILGAYVVNLNNKLHSSYDAWLRLQLADGAKVLSMARLVADECHTSEEE
eukprot:3365409-Amphidinium_carterae.1